MKKFCLLLSCLFLFWGLQAQTIRYVKNGGIGDGSSWNNASGDLQAMINASVANDQVWVAAGSYTPVRSIEDLEYITVNNPFNAFVMKKDVKLIGGFAGNETSPESRDLLNNKTILDGKSFCFHLVVSAGDVGSAILDGFTFTNGVAKGNQGGTFDVNGNSIGTYCGGAMIIYHSSLTVKNCIFTNNSAAEDGGAVYSIDASPAFSGCTFSNNSTSGYDGGAIYNESIYGSASLALTDCSFTGNTARHNGGAIANSGQSNVMAIRDCNISGNTANHGGAIYGSLSSQTIVNSTISGNTSSNEGGAIYNPDAHFFINKCYFYGNHGGDGGCFFNDQYSSITALNSIFNGNTASGEAGAIYNRSNTSTIVNCNFYNNTGAGNGTTEAIYNFETTSVLSNSIVIGGNNQTYDLTWNDIIKHTNCLIQNVADVSDGNMDGTTVVESNIFTNAGNGDFSLVKGSPLINAGNNAIYNTSNYGTSDFAGDMRIMDGTVDIGAMEYRSESKALTATPQNLTLDYKAGETSVNIVSNVNWTVESSASWLKTNVTSGSGNTGLTITFEENASLNVRTATIILKSDGISNQTISISQNAFGITGVNSPSIQKLETYPNPVSDKLFIKGITGNVSVVITSIDGKVIATNQAREGFVSVGYLKAGVYLIKVKDAKELKTGIIIKK
jgi:predicted outer membrane repeat protein